MSHRGLTFIFSLLAPLNKLCYVTSIYLSSPYFPYFSLFYPHRVPFLSCHYYITFSTTINLSSPPPSVIFTRCFFSSSSCLALYSLLHSPKQSPVIFSISIHFYMSRLIYPSLLSYGPLPLIFFPSCTPQGIPILQTSPTPLLPLLSFSLPRPNLPLSLLCHSRS